MFNLELLNGFVLKFVLASTNTETCLENLILALIDSPQPVVLLEAQMEHFIISIESESL
jgi:hypothetical protein